MSARTGAPAVSWMQPLRIREFRWLFVAVLFQNSGMFAMILVAEGVAFDLSGHSSFWASLPYTAVLLPGLFAAPIVGGLIDRFNRPKVMMLSAAVAAVAGAALAVLWATGVRDLVMLAVGCLVVGIGQASLTPAWQAILPGILGTERLLGGGGLTSIASRGGQFIGPAILAWLLAANVVPAVGFAACGLFYLLAGVCAIPLLSVRHLTHKATAGVGLGRLVVGGMAYVGRTPPVRVVILLTGFHCALTMAYMGLLPGKAAEVGAPGLFGVMVTVIGLGSILGCLLLTVLAPRIDATRTLLVTGLLSGLALAWLGLPGTPATVLVACLVVGGSQASFMATSYALLQLAVGDQLRGRIASLSNMLNAGSMSLVALAWGAFAAATDASTVMLTTGFAFVPIVIVAMAVFPPLRRRGGIGAHTAPPGVG